MQTTTTPAQGITTELPEDVCLAGEFALQLLIGLDSLFLLQQCHQVGGAAKVEVRRLSSLDAAIFGHYPVGGCPRGGRVQPGKQNIGGQAMRKMQQLHQEIVYDAGGGGQQRQVAATMVDEGFLLDGDY